MRFRRRLLRRLQTGLYLSGAAALYVRLRGVRGAVIVMYHSVPSSDLESWIDPRNSVSVGQFAAQMRFLARRRNVISLTELVAGMRSGRVFEPGTVVLTFDDGYLDNLEIAAPILSRLRLPATLFLATGYVTRREPQWIDELHCAFRHRTRENLMLPRGGNRDWDLREPASARLAYDRASELLLSATLAERRELLDDVTRQLRSGASPPRLTLGWDDVRRLVRDHPLFEIGVHTCDHVDLTAVNADEVERQVHGSVAAAEDQLDAAVRHFSYPYGRCSALVRDVVARAGLSSAVATEPAQPIVASDDVFALTRFEVTREVGRLPLLTSGAHPGLSMALWGRA